MEPKVHPNLVEGFGGVIVVLIVLYLMPVSCEQYSPTIVGPEVLRDVVQETLPFVVDSLVEIQGEETTQK